MLFKIALTAEVISDYSMLNNSPVSCGARGRGSSILRRRAICF